MTKPSIQIVPEGGKGSDAKLAADIAENYGYSLDPWQFDLIDAILQERSDGKYLSPTFGYSCPRRNGKTHLVIVLILYFLLVQEAEVVYTAHLAQSSGEVWKNVLSLFEETELAEYVKKINRRDGREAIDLTTGASFRIFSRAKGKGTGRGSEADVVILDEALKLDSESLADLLPMTANAENPLTLYLGSPSYEDKAEGVAFRRFRESVIRGDNPLAGWVEYSAPDGADIRDPEVWRAANPAMEAGRITEDFLLGQVNAHDRRTFLVEYLGSWAAEARQTVVDLVQWRNLADMSAALDMTAPVILGVDAANDGSSAAIVAVGQSKSGKRYAEVIEHLPGTGWVDDKLKNNCAKFPNITAVVLDAQSSLAHKEEQWRKDGVPITLTRTEYMANACSAFTQAVEEQAIKHKGDTRLEQSIQGAALRPLMGRFAFTKAEPSSDITLLIAMTLAMYSFDTDKATSAIKRPRSNTVTIAGRTYTRS